MKAPTETLDARLRLHPILAALDTGALRALAEAGTRRKLCRGRVLLRQGEQSHVLVFVLRGRLDIRRDDVRGAPIILRSFGAHGLIGLSMVAGAPCTADVVAGEASEVLMIPGSVVHRVLAADPEAALRVVAYLAELVGALSDELEELRSLDIAERVRRRVRRWAATRREVQVTHAELAAQVGASRANVSRALKQLEGEGLIRRRRGRIEILD